MGWPTTSRGRSPEHRLALLEEGGYSFLRVGCVEQCVEAGTFPDQPLLYWQVERGHHGSFRRCRGGDRFGRHLLRQSQRCGERQLIGNDAIGEAEIEGVPG